MTNLAQKFQRYPQLDNGLQVSERLQTIDNEITDYKTRIAEKEKNCMKLLDDSIGLGTATNAELYTQGQKLDNISKTLRKTEENAHASTQTLTNMEWRKKHPFLSLFMSARQKTKVWFVPSPSTTLNDSEITGQSVRGKNTLFITQSSAKTEFADAVSDKVAILKSLALDMNEELGTQNKKIDELNDHTDHISKLIKSARNRAGEFLR